jgi:hypothetical protein
VNKMMLTVAAVIGLTVSGAARAQDIRTLADGAAPAAATLADLKPLAGDWAGPGGSAGFSAPVAGEVVGHLVLYNDAGPRVQEIWILRPDGASVLARQKHYGADLSAREDKDQWGERRLVARDAKHLYFNNLTFTTGRDKLGLQVRIPGQNGAAPTMLNYTFARVK